MKKITAIILSFILLLSVAPYVYADDTDVELIAHWNFDSRVYCGDCPKKFGADCHPCH